MQMFKVNEIIDDADFQSVGLERHDGAEFLVQFHENGSVEVFVAVGPEGELMGAEEIGLSEAEIQTIVEHAEKALA